MSDPTTEIDGVKRRIVSPEQWRDVLQGIRVREKELTQTHDRLAADRRRAPWVKVTRDYTFEGSAGPARLCDLFDGRRQLIVYHHMLKPADPAPCSGCCMVADQIPHLAHLHQRDTSLVFVARAPIEEIDALKRRMGWNMPWYSTSERFNADFDVTEGFGLNVFYRSRRDEIFRTYFTTGRGAETLGTIWTFLDLTALGRQETWEDAPEGTPQTAPYQWWRLHDEYEG